MAVVYLDIYSGQDPNGAVLVTLTDADVGKFEIGCGENELGAGSFTIRRDHASATEANLAAGNYVKVRIPLIQVEPVWAFWLDEQDDTLIATDEEGNEVLVRSGYGPLAIYARAALLDQFYNGPLGGAARGNYSAPGYWTWTTEPYGAIMVRLTEEGQLQPGFPLSDVTIDWTRTLDSDGVPWPTVNELIQFPIGTDGLSVMQTLVRSGELYLRPDPDLSIHGYGARGADLTGTAYGAGVVRFVKNSLTEPGNILTGLDKQGHGSRAATHAIVTGKDGTYRQVVSPDYVPGETGRWITVDYPDSNDTTLLDKVGAEELRKRAEDQQGLELEFLAGDDEANGRYLPFKHFNTGDLVTLDTGSDPWDYADEPIRVVGFSIELGEASDDATDELEARSLRWTVELSSGQSSGGLTGGTSGGKGCNCLTLCHDHAPVTIYDSFDDRTIAGGTGVSRDWGDASSGPTWTPYQPAFNEATTTVSVGGGKGTIGFPAGGGNSLMYTPAIAELADAITIHTLVDNWPSVGEEAVYLYIDDVVPGYSGSDVYVTVACGADGIYNIELADGAEFGFHTFTPPWEPSAAVHIKWERTPGGLSRAKVWQDGDTEPNWQTSCPVGITVPVTARLQVSVQNKTKNFDYIYFGGAAASCIYGGPLATAGLEDDCHNTAAPCNHDHAYTSAQVYHDTGTVEDALDAVPAAIAAAVAAAIATGVASDPWKVPCRVATTASVTISTALNSGDVIDGVTLASGDRVLVKDQATPAQNGIYVVGPSPARATDFDTGAEVSGAVVFVMEGTAAADTIWYVATNATITVGSTSLSILQYRRLSDAVPGDTAAAGGGSSGTSLDVSRQDHRHGQGGFSAVVSTNSAPGDVATTGSSGSISRRDHLHGRESYGLVGDIVAEAFGDTASAGATAKVANAAHRHAMPANPVTAHEAAADPHVGYQKESEKAAANGYASLGADTLVPQDQLGTGVQDGTKFLRDDGTWQTIAGATPAVDPGDVADPTMATAQEVAEKLNDLMAAMRTAGLLA